MGYTRPLPIRNKLSPLRRFQVSRRFRHEVYSTLFLLLCMASSCLLPRVIEDHFRQTRLQASMASLVGGSSGGAHPSSLKAKEKAASTQSPRSLSTAPRDKGGNSNIMNNHWSDDENGNGVSLHHINGTSTERLDRSVKKTPRPLSAATPLQDLPPLQGNPKDLPESTTMDDFFVHKGNLNRQGREFKDLRALRLPPNRMAILKEFKGMSCAVVGSSGSLFQAKHGLNIISHDVVARVNGAPTSGFEADVGNRTDMRSLSKSFLHRYALAGKEGVTDVATLPLEWGATLLVSGARPDEYNELVDALQDKWGRQDVMLLYSTPKVVSLAKKALGDFRRHLLEESFVISSKGTWPSAGFLTTYLLMLLCRSVTAYGFGPGSSGGKLGRFHYFDKEEAGRGGRRSPPAGKSALDVEFALMRTLSSKGYIDLCMDDGSRCKLEDTAVTLSVTEAATNSRWGLHEEHEAAIRVPRTWEPDNLGKPGTDRVNFVDETQSTRELDDGSTIETPPRVQGGTPTDDLPMESQIEAEDSQLQNKDGDDEKDFITHNNNDASKVKNPEDEAENNGWTSMLENDAGGEEEQDEDE